MVHLLRKQHLALLQEVAVQFIKPEVLRDFSPVYTVPFETRNCLPLSKILVGSETTILLDKLSDAEKLRFQFQADVS